MVKLRGFSLFEVLISLFSATLLMTLIMQQYLISKREYLRTQELLEKQTELKMVTDLIRNSLRQGGFTPCSGIGALESSDRRSGKIGLSAIEVRPDKKNALQINRMGEQFSKIEQILGPRQLILPLGRAYKKQETILIADCFHAEVQRIGAVSLTKGGTVLTLTKPLLFNYSTPAYLGIWLEELYFMQKNCQGELSLFYKAQHAEELSRLINKFQVNFNPQKMLVEVTLGLKEFKDMVMVTKVRAG